MRVLVTGSAGFLASWLIPFLQSHGHFVIGIDRLPENHSNEFIHHDLLTKFLQKPIKFDICLHLASSVGGFLFNATNQDLLETEIKILKNLYKICSDSNVERIIFTSTINVFEVSGVGLEDALGFNIPRTPYAQAKADAEYFISKKFKFFNILRPTNFFGVNQPRLGGQMGRSHVIPDLLHKIRNDEVVDVLGDGEQIRNFIHISDVSRFILILLENGSSPSYINLRSDIFLSVNELVRILMNTLGIQKKIIYKPEYLKFEPAPITKFGMNNATQLGWRSEITDLAEGLSETKSTRIGSFQPAVIN